MCLGPGLAHLHGACHLGGVAKDTAPDPASDPKAARLAELRAAVAKLPAVKIDRVAATEDSKAHVRAAWANKRVAHVVEPPFTIEDAERAVLEVVIAHHAGS